MLSTFSGQSALDVALAVEDMHRSDAFASHVAKLGPIRGVGRESVPVPWSHEHDLSISKCRVRPGRADSESDVEGTMFRDDNNSFILDNMSKPVLTILNTEGLALHEELDIQAEQFLHFTPKRKVKVATSMTNVVDRPDWMKINNR